MSEDPGLSDQYRMASPWPVFVALGFALSEVGIFVGLFPVAVGGLLLFGASVGGILRESEYADDAWLTAATLGGLFALLGAAVVVTQADLAAFDVVAEFADPAGAVGRGLAIVTAGVVLVCAGVVGSLAGRGSGVDQVPE